jgi:hypothetical protein
MTLPTLFFALTACPIGPQPVQVVRQPIPEEQVCAPARATLDRLSSGRIPTDIKLVTASNGKSWYEARVQRPFRYGWDVAIAPDGKLLGRWSTETNGTGP